MCAVHSEVKAIEGIGQIMYARNTTFEPKLHECETIDNEPLYGTLGFKGPATDRPTWI